MAPFVVLFSAYVVFKGHVTPGGGFQGGTVLGALLIALTIIMSEQDARRLMPQRPERLLQAAAPITFFLVGLIGLFVAGDYLAYPHSGSAAWLAEIMLTMVELGIGVGGAMVIATIFRTMGADR
jgi:multicomponent Na+:H+ antiporter subunit B